MQSYLIVIDMQTDFVDGALGTQEAQAIVPAVIRCIEGAQAEGRTVLFTQDTHEANYLHTSEGKYLPVAHCIKGTPGWEIIPALRPFAHTVIEKPTFGFLGLPAHLAEGAGAQGENLDITLCGVCTDICVVSNALLLKASYPEATIRVQADACAGVTPALHDAALAVMKSCQVDILP